jgi:hypothetical protein
MASGRPGKLIKKNKHTTKCNKDNKIKPPDNTLITLETWDLPRGVAIGTAPGVLDVGADESMIGTMCTM